MGIPKAAKHFASLLIPDNQAQRSKAKSSYHVILETISKKPKKQKTIKYLKLAPDEKLPVPLFEAVCADFFRLMDLSIAPTTRAYYDDNECDLFYEPSWQADDIKTIAQGLLDPFVDLKSTYILTKNEIYYLSKRDQKCFSFALPSVDDLKAELKLPTLDEGQDPASFHFRKKLSAAELAIIKKRVGRKHDSASKLVGVASKKLADFKPNKSDPLKIENLLIGELELVSTAEDRKQYTNVLGAYSKTLTPEDDTNQSYSGQLLSYIKGSYNRNMDPRTASYTQSIIDQFTTGYHKLTKDNIIKILLPQLKIRRDHISDLLSKQEKITADNDRIRKYDEEFRRIKTTTQDAAQLQLLLQQLQASKPTVTSITTDLLSPEKKTKYDEEVKALTLITERTLTICKKQPAVTARTIEHFEKLDSIYGGSLDEMSDDKRVLSFDSPGQLLTVTVKDLKNYRMIKGLATGLVTSYIYKEGDCHNRNLSKNGKRIDFDMTLWDISYQWKEYNLLQQLKRFPVKGGFKITPEDILNFPNLEAKDFYYWPTKHTDASESVINTVHENLKYWISDNFYTKHDNEVYQQLATHPIFIFHKYKALLKFMLTTAEMHKNIINLHMLPEHDVMIAQTLPATAKLKNSCVITPKGLYQYNEYGDTKLILDEFELSQYANELGLQAALETAKKLSDGSMVSVKDQLNTDQFNYFSEKVIEKGGVSLHGTTYLDKNTKKEKSLPNEMLANVSARIEEVRKVLVSMPQFSKFLIEYGETAVNMILNEFHDYKTKYESKSPEKAAIFKDMVDSIRLGDIKQEYMRIFSEANPGLPLPKLKDTLPIETTPTPGVTMRR